eukprot:TRINITY_DN18630_c0_g1_i1.p1 TRINITY_DN18630_c0_g1~~TRINITY_DN18630_c0_g1_i1.p1  ORF type:complete len:498 (-),score=97.03 TRINITY_DN18630_c0_g1_i1:377-1870(-)
MLRTIVVAILTVNLHVGRAATSRPNIVWIMADDLGWGEPGLYPSESAHGRIATPILDQFGREGIVFHQAYSGYTVCAPSRTAFFTGRQSGKFVEHGLNGESIRPDQNVTTVAQILKTAGYKTGAFGKVAPLVSPLEQGFDIFTGQVDQALCHNMYPKQIDTGRGQLNFDLTGNYRKKSRELCMAQPKTYNYTIDVFHDYGMAWLESVAGGADPFFLYLSYTVPHAGGWGDAPAMPEDGAPVPTDLQYADKPWPDVEKDHAAVITYLDMKVGDVLGRLKTLGIDHDTLVFFASDNGAHLEGGHSHLFFNSTGGLPGHKRSMYEGGVRSPTMVRWPAVIKPSRKSEFAWAFWDVLPTLAEVAGAGKNIPNGLDGLSILPELRGEEQPVHEYLFFTWQGDGGRGMGELTARQSDAIPGYTVRSGHWKGMVPHCKDKANLKPGMADEMRLYNLMDDPYETTDVASSRPDVVDQLKRLVLSKQLSCMCFQCDFHKEVQEIIL